MLDPVRDTGEARRFIAGADAIPGPHRHKGSGADLLHKNLEAVVEGAFPDVRGGRLNVGGVHISII
jgi:hypothetical protein